MLPYQEKYLNNTSGIIAIIDGRKKTASDFDTWYGEQTAASARLKELRDDNIRILNDKLFPMLDGLHGESEENIKSLVEFGDALMDWRTNLDCGVYVAIHDAMLSMYRYRKDRDGIIRELYKLGMGLYYLRRSVEGVKGAGSDSITFRNELVFTEAGSYIRYYDEIDNEETRGYIIRALANVAICTKDHKRKIAASMRALEITRDEHFRELAPGLPWEAFQRKLHQQMSANRKELSSGDLTMNELAAVLDSCYEVFRPEEGAENPSVRWLWPYYEMEYNCGYVDAELTLNRIERLNGSVPYDQYDMSGLYANVQLPIYYGQLLREDSKALRDPGRIGFYSMAVDKMLKALFTCPAENMDDYYYYLVDLVITSYYETDGVPAYAELIPRFMKRFNMDLYIRSERIGEITEAIAEAIMMEEPGFFDDIGFLTETEDPELKKEAVLKFARESGIYQDFGAIKMNLGRTMAIRELFENEFGMYMLHTVSGYEDLKERSSTEKYADIALGHHRWYDGTDGYPEEYVRNDSQMRQMTDIAAIATELVMAYDADPGADTEALLDEIIAGGGTRFSPMAAAYLADETLRDRIEVILKRDKRELYYEIYQELIS